jgi:hypothetical protein
MTLLHTACSVTVIYIFFLFVRRSEEAVITLLSDKSNVSKTCV